MHRPLSFATLGTVVALTAIFAVPVSAKPTESKAHPTPKSHPVKPAPGKDARTTNHGATVAPKKSATPAPVAPAAPAAASTTEVSPSPTPQPKPDRCEKATTRITDRLTKTGVRADTMLGEFDAAGTGAQDYYNDTVLPAGGEVADYGNYVAAIQVTRTAVSTALANSQDAAAAFTCADAKGLFAAYRASVKSLNTALKDYRKAVNALIEAVDAAAAGIPTPEPTPTEEPSAEPSAEPSTEPTPEPSPLI